MSSPHERTDNQHGGLSRDQIEASRARHPIEQVIATYVELRPAGHRLVAHCPLPGHEDKNPSFSVYPDERRFHCYGCNRGGDVFTFLQLIEGVSFREAVARLEGNGRTITTWNLSTPSLPAKAAQRSPLDDGALKLLTAAAQVYHTSLLLNPKMLNYVTGRGITLETIRRYRLGYATGENLGKYFRFRGWDLQLAKELSLINERGEFFRQRIILPEWRQGRAVYLTGRKTVEYQKIKYLGLPGAPKPLYGLELVQEVHEVYVVEGGFDMLTLLQWGYPAVALLGSHLKEEWVEELAIAKRIFIVTDSDQAGRAAARQLARVFNKRAIVVPPLPHAKDVNELAMQPDGEAVFRALLAQTREHPEIQLRVQCEEATRLSSRDHLYPGA